MTDSAVQCKITTVRMPDGTLGRVKRPLDPASLSLNL